MQVGRPEKNEVGGDAENPKGPCIAHGEKTDDPSTVPPERRDLVGCGSTSFARWREHGKMWKKSKRDASDLLGTSIKLTAFAAAVRVNTPPHDSLEMSDGNTQEPDTHRQRICSQLLFYVSCWLVDLPAFPWREQNWGVTEPSALASAVNVVVCGPLARSCEQSQCYPETLSDGVPERTDPMIH